jgi:hypothetical protein
MPVDVLGYVSRWQIDGEACHGYVTTLAEHDLRLWTLAVLAKPYCHRPQWLRMRGVTIGTWFVATAFASSLQAEDRPDPKAWR